MAKARLGSYLESLHGTLGETTITKGKHGTIIRERARYRPHSSDLQNVCRARMKVVNAAWETLTPSGAKAWQIYADTLTRFDAATDTHFTPTGYNVFVSLSLKFVQASPGVSVPKLPPATAFRGDTITVSVSGGAGGLTFTASGSNRAGVTTELLLQKLVNPRRKPTPTYIHAAFVGFTSLQPTRTVSVSAGWFVSAYCFVDAGTGQKTEAVLLNAVEVTAAVALELREQAA